MSEKIAILGAGNMGTALAFVLSSKHKNIRLFTIEPDVVDDINTDHENKKYLPGVILPEDITAYGDIEDSVKGATIIILSVPSHIIPTMTKNINNFLKGNEIIINVAKGIDAKTHKRMSEIIEANIDKRFKKNVVSLSGPSIAHEIGKNLPTAVVISSKNPKILARAQKALTTKVVTVQINNDLIGVELGGSLKNSMAIAVGIADALKLGCNAKSLVMSSGFYEMMYLGVKMGANPITFCGLSGVGDLIATSEGGRNRKLGFMIGSGKSVDEAQKEIGQVTEGVAAAKMMVELAKEYKIKLPLAEEVYNILYNNKNPKKAIEDFVYRKSVHEFDKDFLKCVCRNIKK